MNFVAQPEPRANDSELLAVRKRDSKFIDFFKKKEQELIFTARVVLNFKDVNVCSLFFSGIIQEM